MSLLEKLKKGFRTGWQSASDKTSEYTRMGRIKIDMLGIKKEIEEKFIELGGRVYHNATQTQQFNIKKDKMLMQIIEQLKELENELSAYEGNLKEVKKEEEQDKD